MVCKNCGKEIDDTSIYCEHCGAELAEPVILDQNSLEKVKQYEKDKKQKEKQNARELLKKQEEERRMKRKEEKSKEVPFYENPKSFLICKILSFAAGGFMLLVPFLHWKYLWVNDGIGKRQYTGFSLMDQCKIHEVPAVVISILFILNGIIMLYFAFQDNNETAREPKIKLKETQLLIFRILPVIVGILLLIVYTHMPVYKNSAKNFQELKLSYQSSIDVSKAFHPELKGLFCRMGNGAAFLGVGLSILLYIFTQGFRFVLNTLNEEEDED